MLACIKNLTDIEKAFNKIVLNASNIEPSILGWVSSMLKIRVLHTELRSDEI